MSDETVHPYTCSPRYAELCALSTSDDLSAQEAAELIEHVAVCKACAALLREYTSLIHVALADLAPAVPFEEENAHPFHEWRAERRLMSALHAETASELTRPLRSIHGSVPASSWESKSRIAIVTAAAVLLCVGGSFELGRKFHSNSSHASPGATTLAAPATAADSSGDLEEKLSAAQSSLAESEARSTESEKRIAELARAKASLLAQIDQLTRSDQATSSSLIAMEQQRDTLQQQLNDTSKSLEQVKEDLNHLRQERQSAVLRAASLEEEVNSLRANLASAGKTASTDEQFLTQDRDIRDLMGARQLYIADVLDVEHNGQRSKPFGRVFYTKGRSLIFYAFDLEAEPEYRATKAFQAWGKPDSSSAKPISLGIFYLDSEQNRRWVVKTSNSDVLAQINAVFVTVEPKGGSEKPTGKPFLEAYLHTLPPNHP
jgi:Anti-sigma-K factor rskA